MKIYKTLALPTLLYGCETWAIGERDKYRMSAEMKLMRTAKYTWQDHRTNWRYLSEFKINSVVKKIQNYRHKCVKHVRRMDRNRLTVS